MFTHWWSTFETLSCSNTSRHIKDNDRRYHMFFHLLTIITTARNDLEQLNSYDKIMLREDEESFATIPSSLPERKPLSRYDIHARNLYNSGPLFYRKPHHKGHAFSLHSHEHVRHRPHKKDSFGNHVYTSHLTNRSNVTPDSDMYVSYDSMHYPPFPFKERLHDDYSTENGVSESGVNESLGLFGAFH